MSIPIFKEIEEKTGWKIGKIIGDGDSANVYYGMKDEKKAAIRIPNGKESYSKKDYENNLKKIKIARKLPNIFCEVIDYFTQKDIENMKDEYGIITILELAEMTLGTYITQIDEKDIDCTIETIKETLVYYLKILKKSGIKHTDLTPENVGLFKNQKEKSNLLNLKLMDVEAIKFDINYDPEKEVENMIKYEIIPLI